MLHVACCVRLHTLLHVVVCCWEMLRKVWNRLNFWLTIPNISLDPWSPKRSATMWMRLYSSSDIVGTTHAHYTWSPVSFLRCTAGPNIIQQCWELLHQFVHHSANTDSQRRCPNNIGSCCVCLRLFYWVLHIKHLHLHLLSLFRVSSRIAIFLDLDPCQESSPPFLSGTFVKRAILLNLAIVLWRLTNLVPRASLTRLPQQQKGRGGK